MTNLENNNFILDATMFDNYKWLEVIEETKVKQCKAYYEAFKVKKSQYRDSGDSTGEHVFNFLSKLSSSSVNPLDLEDTTFIEKFIKDIFDINEIFIAQELINQIQDAEFRARIADILWLYKEDSDRSRPIKMAEEAVEAYLKSAIQLENVNDWMDSTLRIRRASQLARIVDGKKSYVQAGKIIAHVDGVISRHESQGNKFLTGSSMKILQEEKIFDKKVLKAIMVLPDAALKYASIAGQKAISKEPFETYHEAYCHQIAYHKIESIWYKIAVHQEDERNARLKEADVEIWYAHQAIIEGEPQAYGVASDRLKSAIAKIKKIEDKFGKHEDTSNKMEDLHKILLKYQQKSFDQRVEFPFDISDLEMQNRAQALVRSMSFEKALRSLALIFFQGLIPSISDLEKEANSSSANSLSRLVSTAFVDSEGKTKAITIGDINSQDEMFRIADFYHMWYGSNFILPACEQIKSEHSIQVEDFLWITENNPFIPDDRQGIYSRGLLAALQGDLVIAAHLLIPQLENSLRHILKRQGFISSHLTSDSIQDEYTLNKVLELSELGQLLHQDVIFTLRSLLCERKGANIRNELCHGLLNHDQLCTGQIRYLSWLTLHLCFIHKFPSEAVNNS
jgi:hypothetical protein